MTLKYMLDTNIVSHLMKEPNGNVAAKIDQVGENCVCCSVICACELRYGAFKKGSDTLTRHIDAVLSVMRILPFTVPSDIEYGFIRNQLASAGKPIGPNDLLIAAHAKSEELILVTDNEKEFRRVDSLSVENWSN